MNGLHFSYWVDTVKVKLEKETSVINIAYTNSDKALILPVINRNSKQYQDYSGRDLRCDIASTVAYLKQSVTELNPKAESSMQRA